MRIFLMALFSLFLMAAPAYAETSPTDIVKGFYTSLETTMKDGPKLGFEGRYNKLYPAVDASFDMPLMARYAVGPDWNQADEQTKKDLIDAFTAFSVATYASRFTSYDGEIFSVVGEQPTMQKAVMVETTLTPKGDEPVKLNYLVRKGTDANYRIADVYLDASISELATRRADFASTVKSGGMKALIKSLRDKVEAMRTKSK